VDHYTGDVVIATLCPESPPIVGREALLKASEAALKGGLKDYSGKVKAVRLIGESSAWSTGTFTFTITGKDGAPRWVQGNWIDMLKREGTEWRVSFQARNLCSP
jgi:ketosteroid isomerase-like protein